MRVLKEILIGFAALYCFCYIASMFGVLVGICAIADEGVLYGLKMWGIVTLTFVGFLIVLARVKP